MKIKYPIRYKFLFVSTMLLILSVVSYLALASNIFKNDKIELVYDLNRSAVSGLSAEVTTQFRGVGDKMKLAAILSRENPGSGPRVALDDLLRQDGNIVFIAASYGFERIDHVFYIDESFASTYGLEKTFFEDALPKSRPMPFADIRTTGEAVWNATVPEGPPLVGFGRNVVIEDGSSPTASSASSSVPFGIIAFVRADRMVKLLAGGRVNEAFIVNSRGETLVHPNPDVMLAARSVAEHPLFKTAAAQAMKAGVTTVQHEGRELLGAYSLAADGKLIVLSQVDGSHVFSAVERLIRRSLIFAMIAITVAFLIAIVFSRSLTQPIQALTEAMGRVSDGELGTRIDVKTNDETALLAASFNDMIRDLQVSRAQLEEINRELEQKVRDRTRKLEEQNLAVKKAQEALLQSTRLAAVGEVAGHAAHEVLNPLTSIVTRLEKVRSRLQQGPVQNIALVHDIFEGWKSDIGQGGFERLVQNWRAPSAVDGNVTLWQEDIENVSHFETEMRQEVQTLIQDTDFLIRESQRINKIIQNMRGLTRVKGDLQILSASQLLREAAKIMADLCIQENIEVREEFAATDDHVRVDADEFIQVATNMLRNSIQAIRARQFQGLSESGRITLAIAQGPHGVHIRIRDNGVGIDANDRAKLFEIQFSTKTHDEGTGLGLSISRRFIRAFGGDIHLVHSAPDEGCEFEIQLPLATGAEISKVAV
ncbi:MAG: ATP-binding protein [Bdellovibrionaceae bacterium]|nr:ATP-binding protein [Pseudobdellovibrionaceae bacterium]